MLFFNFKKHPEKSSVNENHLWIETAPHSRHEKKQVSTVTERTYFRVDTQVVLSFWPLDAQDKIFSLPIHYKVNLSGSGIRFPLRQPALLYGQFGLEIKLPDQSSDTPIYCCGRVVRKFRNDRQQTEVALEFFDLNEKDRDRIVSYCFSVQRRILREKVRVATNTLDS